MQVCQIKHRHDPRCKRIISRKMHARILQTIRIINFHGVVRPFSVCFTKLVSICISAAAREDPLHGERNRKWCSFVCLPACLPVCLYVCLVCVCLDISVCVCVEGVQSTARGRNRKWSVCLSVCVCRRPTSCCAVTVGLLLHSDSQRCHPFCLLIRWL